MGQLKGYLFPFIINHNPVVLLFMSKQYIYIYIKFSSYLRQKGKLGACYSMTDEKKSPHCLFVQFLLVLNYLFTNTTRYFRVSWIFQSHTQNQPFLQRSKSFSGQLDLENKIWELDLLFSAVVSFDL